MALDLRADLFDFRDDDFGRDVGDSSASLLICFLLACDDWDGILGANELLPAAFSVRPLSFLAKRYISRRRNVHVLHAIHYKAGYFFTVLSLTWRSHPRRRDSD